MSAFDDIVFLQSASRICFVIAIAAAVLAVALFFLLDIKDIFLIETGRAQRKTIEEMNARNLRTGKLRDDTESDLRNSGGITVKSTVAGKTQSPQEVSAHAGANTAPSGHSGYAKPSGNTMKFSDQQPDIFSAGQEEAVLGAQNCVSAPNSSFRITQKAIITHTEERIPV